MFDILTRSFSTWRKVRGAYNDLSRLSDRELDDLGIRRGDIDNTARDRDTR